MRIRSFTTCGKGSQSRLRLYVYSPTCRRRTEIRRGRGVGDPRATYPVHRGMDTDQRDVSRRRTRDSQGHHPESHRDPSGGANADDRRGGAPDPAVDACVREYRAFTDAVALDKQLKQAKVAVGEARGRFSRAKAAVKHVQTIKNRLGDAGLVALRMVGGVDPYVAAGVRVIGRTRRGLRSAGRYAMLPLRFARRRRGRSTERKRERAERAEHALSPAERAFLHASNACPGKEDMERLSMAFDAAQGQYRKVVRLLELRNHKGLESTQLVGAALRTRIFSLSSPQQSAVALRVGGSRDGGRSLVSAGRRISRILPLEPAMRAGVEASLKAAAALNAVTMSFLGGRGLGRGEEDLSESPSLTL